jgi:hypothetical protein
LNIYFNTGYDLIEAKKIANNEIKAELKIHVKENFYSNRNLIKLLNGIPEEYFDTMLENNQYLKNISDMLGIKTNGDMIKAYSIFDFEKFGEVFEDQDRLENIKNMVGLNDVNTDDIINKFKGNTFDIVIDESETLKEIIEEIEEFEIENVTNLKTSNSNYIFHMGTNYEEEIKSLKEIRTYIKYVFGK